MTAIFGSFAHGGNDVRYVRLCVDKHFSASKECLNKDWLRKAK